MKTEILHIFAALQIVAIKSNKDTCNAGGGSCFQMTDEKETPEMGQVFCTKSYQEESVFPDTLEGFGYSFNEDGQMRDIVRGEPFVFEVKQGDRAHNQKHYEALGEVITEHVYKLLEEEVQLKKHYIPIDAEENEGQSFFFVSDDAKKADKLMILIHGSGVVRAGQWARRLIINNDLNSGTMLPYIRRAKQEGYGVLITNGNQNYVSLEGKKKRVLVRGSESPEDHFIYVWDKFISQAAAQAIFVVAHSFGGVVIVQGLLQRKEALDRMKAVAFTDSVHSLSYQRADKRLRTWMGKNSRNWISSDLPLDTPMSHAFHSPDCDRVSAGTPQHELTSHTAIDSVFKFFAEKLGSQTSEETEGSQMGVDVNSETSPPDIQDHNV